MRTDLNEHFCCSLAIEHNYILIFFKIYHALGKFLKFNIEFHAWWENTFKDRFIFYSQNASSGSVHTGLSV